MFWGRVPFGELGLVQSTLGMAGLMAGMGPGETATGFVAKYATGDPLRAGRVNALVMSVSVCTVVLAALVLISVSGLIAGAIHDAPHLQSALVWGSLLLAATAFRGIRGGVSRAWKSSMLSPAPSRLLQSGSVSSYRVGLLSRGKAARKGWRCFGLSSAKYLRDVDILHVRAGAGREGAIAKAKRAGMKVVVDQSIAHPVFMARVLKDEHSKYWLAFWMGPDDSFWRSGLKIVTAPMRFWSTQISSRKLLSKVLIHRKRSMLCIARPHLQVITREKADLCGP